MAMYRVVGFNPLTTGPSGRRPAIGRLTGLNSAYRMPRFSTRGRPRIFSPEIVKPIEICYSIPDTRRLGPKPLEDILTPEGKINTNETETTKAAVFAIFDENKKLQYIGFSKGLKDSLRTVFTRRPDKAYYFKSANLTKLDQEEMIGIRNAWFTEVGGPPSGNKLALERAAWQQPADVSGENKGGSRVKVAEEYAAKLIEKIRARGCTEELVPNPELLPQGQVDLMLVENFTDEEMAEKKANMEAIEKATRYGKVTIDEEESEFSVYFKRDILTNGGAMFDILVTHNEQVTNHRVIVGSEYYEPYGLTAEEVVMLSFAFVIEQEMERQTEGILHMTQFPINYFTVADLDQQFAEFREFFQKWTGADLAENSFWRFSRVHDYGGIEGDSQGYTGMTINSLPDRLLADS